VKAITLLQPWASLVALGVKRIETRSWSTSYRGLLAIHAGARQVHSGQFLMLARTARSAGLIDADTEAQFRRLDVPFGAVVATCRLVDVVSMDDIVEGMVGLSSASCGWAKSPVTERGWVPRRNQLPYGDFGSGRFAWLLADIQPLDMPIEARGRQQLWNWTEPLAPGFLGAVDGKQTVAVGPEGTA
jgi:activating signal cointegrator 1